MKEKESIKASVLESVNNLSPERRALLAQRLKNKESRARQQRIEAGSDGLQKAATMAALDGAVAWADRGSQFPPLARVPRDGEIPLSFGQQRLWFLDQLEPASIAYNVPQALRIAGPLDARAVEVSIREVIRRHENLRTTFASVGGRPSQIIAPAIESTLPVVDLQHLPDSQREAEARRLANEEAGRSFDLAFGPLLRMNLIRLQDEDHILLLTMHHIISDGWSMSVLVKELMALYEAALAGSPSPLSELPIQYADYSYWQRNWLKGEVLEKHLSYWTEQLKGSPPELDLPVDFARPTVQTFRGSYRSRSLDPSLCEEIKALSRSQGASVFMTLLAAFNALLYKHTGQEDIVVGCPIANRKRAELEQLIGFFTNTLALRTDLSGDPTFIELLGRVREMALGAFAHQDLPFEKLVEELQPERNLGRQPLFQVMFVFQNLPTVSPDIPRIKLTPFNADILTAKFDLNFLVMETEQSLAVALEYSTDLFHPSTIERMLAHFESLLKCIAAQPERRISEMSPLSQAEKQQLLARYNDTNRDYPCGLCIHQLFEAQVDKSPDALAVVFEDRQMKYSELNGEANRLARYMMNLGVGPDVCVAISVERSIDMIVAVLAVLKAGGAYVPLDPSYPRERISFMLEDSQATVLLTESKLLAHLPDQRAYVICLDKNRAAIAELDSANPRSSVTANNLGYVIYTSGSTGKPKGIGLPHAALVNLIQWHDSTMLRCARTSQFMSLSFDASFHEMFSAWQSGGTLFVIPEMMRRDIEALVRYLHEAAIEKITLPVVMLQQLAEHCVSRDYIPTSLKEITATGEQLQITSPVKEFFKRLNGCPLHNHYGPSETHVVTAYTLDGTPELWPALPPIGYTIANTQAFVLDRYLQLAPEGARGELYFSGIMLARGYLNRPELTAEKFIPNPYVNEPGARMYKTGDIARYLPGGCIEYLGRADHQLKIRGYRVEPGEVEVMLERHPAIREAVVVARDDGSGGKRLVAYIVTKEKPGPAVSQLQNFLRDTLPDYLIPSLFVEMDELPLTPSGKLDRRSLPEPDGARRNQAAEFIAPRNAAEEVVAGIWAGVLRLERVGVHDKFFELGGHSLLATQVISRVRDAFQTELPLRSLFEKPTVEGVVNALVEAWGNAEIVEEIAETWKQVQQLSQGEVQEMLSAK
jgi:amino acid adenylation domain-containing protein